tara:strand:+ start:5239 stop:5841 length:603 start_codon:yes stop_codon:yes gene_type:complete
MKISKENLNKLGFPILSKFGNCWIAGGSIASIILDEKIENVDIFFPNEESRKQAVKKFVNMGAEKINSYPLGDKFKFDDKIYDLLHAGRTPEETITSFDWTACCAVIDKKGNFLCHENFLEDICAKKLNFINNHAGSYQLSFKNKTKRLMKYLEKGYQIDSKILKYWLSKIISDQNKLRNKKKIQIIKFNIIKSKIDLNK